MRLGCALGIALWLAVGQVWGQPPTPRTITITLTDDLYAAAKRRLGIVSDDPVLVSPPPRADGTVSETAVAVTVEDRIAEWATRAVRNELRPELDAVRAEKADQVERDVTPVMAGLKSLTPARCRALAKELGVAVATLPCGGNQ